MTRLFSGSELVIATHNKGKMAEISDMFRDKAIKLYSAADLGLESPPETGATFIENATMKAQFVAKATGKPALADDSGLCVEALEGAPGVYTADWAEEKGARDFHYAMTKIHASMGDNPNRKATFVSVLVLCWPDGHCETAGGEARGQIVWPMRGKEGHGCDPIFQSDGYDVTYAEMPAEEKNGISHRADAFRKMMKKCFP
jgi:XTP/dITP diphosphohydrolase